MSEIITRQRVTTFLTHLLCITILLIIPEVLTTLSSSRPIRPWVYTQAIVYLAVFYINYYVIIEKSLDKPRRIFRIIAYNLIVIACALFILYLLWRFRSFMGGKDPMRHHINPSESAYIAKWVVEASRDLVMFILIIGLAAALRLGDKWLRLDRRQRDLVSSQREEELKNLKSQLNPHFLFNTLNSIYALIAISPEKAQGAVHELSRLLRYMLYDSPATVSLRQETDFISDYVNLMRLRLNPAIKLDFIIDTEGHEDNRIAPLLFVTSIENVFKHGIHTPSIPLRIEIHADDTSISCITSNGRQDCDNDRQHQAKSESGGIGLSNLRRRLDLIYGKDASLEIATTPTLYQLKLTITSTPRQ